MDGSPLVEVFEANQEIRRQGSSYKNPAPTNDEASGSIYTAAEEAELKQRLRALGYIE
jgi:hypothetical protein